MLLFVIRYSLFVIRYSLFVIRYSADARTLYLKIYESKNAKHFYQIKWFHDAAD
jgi:hypothetical protein